MISKRTANSISMDRQVEKILGTKKKPNKNKVAQILSAFNQSDYQF